MSILSKLFGGKSDQGGDSGPKTKPEEHNGFLIYVEPIKEASGYRVAARIEKEIAGEVKSHLLIRADTCSALEEAERITLLKSKLLIDQMGEGLFT